jgi:hypothetical protein
MCGHRISTEQQALGHTGCQALPVYHLFLMNWSNAGGPTLKAVTGPKQRKKKAGRKAFLRRLEGAAGSRINCQRGKGNRHLPLCMPKTGM